MILSFSHVAGGEYEDEAAVAVREFTALKSALRDPQTPTDSATAVPTEGTAVFPRPDSQTTRATPGRETDIRKRLAQRTYRPDRGAADPASPKRAGHRARDGRGRAARQSRRPRAA
ncbi:hypothetical protein GCM10010425_24740 [Streptomyces spororaveus]|uniref:Uncharacterized protein n=1 Tax=Streptomyces spororaveus TaxID=284039 RepID=A0ABQ3TGQ8_9ACTN|nr:hypothetical protein Sspor_51500 [Streptomyces spororaveus]